MTPDQLQVCKRLLLVASLVDGGCGSCFTGCLEDLARTFPDWPWEQALREQPLPHYDEAKNLETVARGRQQAVCEHEWLDEENDRYTSCLKCWVRRGAVP